MKKIITGQTILLMMIIILAAVLRIYKLGSIPSGFHQDEVVNTYVGKYIIKNSVDLYGNKFPFLYFDKWGDYPPVLPMYFNGLGSLIFGDNVFGARIVVAILGILTILNIFLLAKKIFENKAIALFSAFFLTINPWHIAFSRTGTEGITALFFYTLALILFAYKKNIYLIFFFLTYLLYPGFRIIIPFTFLGLLIFDYSKTKKFSKFLVANIIISILLTLLIGSTQWGQSRFTQTSIINHVKDQKEYFNKFIFNENSVIVARIFNNKPIFIFWEFLRQFFSYFSPVYLFIEGGKPNWFSYPNSGLFYLSDLLLLILSLYFFVKNKSVIFKRRFVLIFYLLLVAVMPAALTNEHSPNMHRSLLMVVFFSLLVGVGFQTLTSLKKNKFWLIFLGIVIFGEFIYFSHNYFQHVSMYTSIARSDGNKQMALYLKDKHSKYDKVYVMVSGWFPIYYLYFSGDYSRDLVGKIQNGMRMASISNIGFINQDCPSNKNYDQFASGEGENLVIFSTTCSRLVDPRLVKIEEIINSVRIPIYIVYKTVNK